MRKKLRATDSVHAIDLASGGGLAKPAEQYPGVFGNSNFFQTYPYALATIASGTFAASAAIITAVFVKEVSPWAGKHVAVLEH